MTSSRYGANVAACSLKVRMGFVRKVYAIVATQLLVTSIMGATFMNNEVIKTYVQSRYISSHTYMLHYIL